MQELKNRYQLTFCSDIINSSSKHVCSNEADIFNDTCNSALYCSIAIESSAIEMRKN